MLEMLWLVPLLPLAGFVVLATTAGRLAAPGVAAVGAGSVGASALVAVVVAAGFLQKHAAEPVLAQSTVTWMSAGGFSAAFGLHLDALSLVMMLVVTVVGFLIHLYSVEFMSGEEGYARYFAYMNLFVAAMLILVLADNLLFLYLGWEGVGLCSYLLIGFWYRDPANGLAARKAFVVTRVGDAAMAIGLILLFTELGSLHIDTVMGRATAQWPADSAPAVAAAALLLAGAVGKSAQLPLQTWLPDAMAGPTPVSALIHAATMVTAGMYLVARTHPLFVNAPTVQLAVAVVGALTLLLAGTSALAQRDIKRVLAYSTISQIGYMFLALGVGAWAAGVFHFMTHAFFKALLFLGAGALIKALDGEHDIHRMGGLWRRMPFVFWTFAAGTASLAGLPLVTAGFFSKDRILWLAFASEAGGPWLWGAGLLGALLTAVYAFRLLFVVFLGEQRTPVARGIGYPMAVPVAVLALLAVAGGWVRTPHGLGEITLFSDLLETAVPAATLETGLASAGVELVLALLGAGAAIGGLAVAWLVYARRSALGARLVRAPAARSLARLWAAGWGFDSLYHHLFVRPFVGLARRNRDDAVDRLYDGLAAGARACWAAASATQNGNVRRYAGGVALGAIFVVAMGLLA